MKTKMGRSNTCQETERYFSGQDTIKSLTERQSTIGVDALPDGHASCVSLRMDSLSCRAVYLLPHTKQSCISGNTDQSRAGYTGVKNVPQSTACSAQSTHNGLTKRRSASRTKLFGPSWALLVITVLFSSFVPTDSFTVPHNFNDLSESPLETQTNVYDPAAEDGKLENPELSAKEFLGKFGYVRPAEWTSVSPRFVEDGEFHLAIDEGESSSRDKDAYEGSGEEEDKEKNLVRWSFEDISEEEYQRALIKYQRINGLNATGELDEDTKEYMGKPRCGVPDRTAAIKVNRTIDTASQSTTTTAPITSAPATTSDWINSTTGYWINSNYTDAEMDNGSDVTTASAITGAPSVFGSATTAAAPDGADPSGTHDDMDGSGDFASGNDQDLVRRKRFAGGLEEGGFRMQASFEHGFHLVEDNSYPEVPGRPSMVHEFGLEEIRTRRVNFKDLNDAPISEAELPNESRVTDMQGILEALRREKQSQMNETVKKEDGKTFDELVSNIRPTPAPPLPGLVKRIVLDTRSNRRKRSSAYLYGKTNGWLMAFPKRVITWRLVEEWASQRTFMIPNEIWFTIKLAFRMWSEILPRGFREDNTSPATDVDILIGFGRGEHNRCLIPFYKGPFTHEYAHAWPLPQAEIHFNDDQPFVSVSYEPSRDVGFARPMSLTGTPISLLKVATHEIGHTLGLPHKKDRSSVMNPVYIPYQSKKVVELESVDRQAIQALYGSCNMAFDAVFDWVRQDRSDGGGTRWKYNTFFFRNTWFWLYENRARRPRYGDPKFTVNFWRGVLSGPNDPHRKIARTDPHRKIDGIVHIRDWSTPNGPIYFFTGDTFSEYDSSMDRVKTEDSNENPYPRAIKDGFPGIPYPIDTVFYKWQESLLYFFKDSHVYKFDWKKGKVVSTDLISRTFPGWGGAAPLSNNIDAAYYSYTDSAYYFFKGIYFWKLADEREKYYNKGLKILENAVGPRQLISSKWKYICDVDETEMQMSLPPEKQLQQTNQVQVKSGIQ